MKKSVFVQLFVFIFVFFVSGAVSAAPKGRHKLISECHRGMTGQTFAPSDTGLREEVQVAPVQLHTDASVAHPHLKKGTNAFLVFNKDEAILASSEFEPLGRTRYYCITGKAPGDSTYIHIVYMVNDLEPSSSVPVMPVIQGVDRNLERLCDALATTVYESVDFTTAKGLFQYSAVARANANEELFDSGLAQKSLRETFQKLFETMGKAQVVLLLEQRKENVRTLAQSLESCHKLDDSLIADAAKRQRRVFEQTIELLDQIRNEALIFKGREKSLENSEDKPKPWHSI
jgi:hypothetical protein